MVDDASKSGIDLPPGDRHIVSVLFADVISSTKLTAELDPDDIREIMDHATGMMADAVRTFDGSVVRFQGDGIEAVFGAPRPAEDHALRACLAGLAIQKAFALNPSPRPSGAAQLGVPLQVRVGIHSGLVIAREMNSDLGRGIDLLGATVSLAALSEKICPAGAVMATSATAELAGAFLESAPFEPVGHELAGRYTFVRVLGVNLAAPSIHPAPNPVREVFVGRIDEQQTILRAFDEISQGGRIVGLIGDAGIGKSRLSIEIARTAAARQVPVFQLRGMSLMQATPYAPIRGLLFSLLGGGDRPETAAVATIAADLGLAAPETAGLFELLGLETGSAAEDGQERRERLVNAFCEIVLKASATRPTLLIVDDFHLLDAETVTCLLRLGRRIGASRAFILVNGRPEARDAMRRLTRDIIELAPLAGDDLLRLMVTLDPVIAENGELASRIAERSGGVPFVLEQILRAMSLHGASFDDRMLPTNVASMVLARLNHLSGPAKQLAQLASIMGEEINYPLLARVAGGSLSQPDSTVRELVEGGFFAAITGDVVRFKHSLIRDACLDSIVRPERRRLHAQALTRFEEHFASLSPYFEQLAYHAEGAGRDELAIEYLWSAAKNAARNSAMQSLELLFGRAMACCERLGAAGEKREVDFVLLAFDAMQQHGKLMNVVPRLARTAELAAKQGRKDKECLARAHLATVLWFTAQYEAGRTLADRAVTLAREIQAPPALFYTQFTLANLRYGCGDIAGSIELLQSNVAFLSGDLERAHLGALGIPSVMSRSFLAWHLMDLGRFDDARQHIERGVEIADADGRPYSRVLAHIARGRLSYERGDYAAAAEILGPVRDWCLRHHIFAMDPGVTGLLASALCRIGAGDAALAATQASIDRKLFHGAARLALFYLFAGHGEALFACGETARGLEIVAKAVAETETPYDPCLCVPGHILHGQLLLPAGEADLARASFERALAVALEIGMVPSAARAHEGLAQCSREASGRDRHAQAAASLYRQCGLDRPASHQC